MEDQLSFFIEEIPLILTEREAEMAIHPQIVPLLLLQPQEVRSHEQILIAKGVQNDTVILIGDIQQSLIGLIALLDLHGCQVQIGRVNEILDAVVLDD